MGTEVVWPRDSWEPESIISDIKLPNLIVLRMLKESAQLESKYQYSVQVGGFKRWAEEFARVLELADSDFETRFRNLAENLHDLDTADPDEMGGTASKISAILGHVPKAFNRYGYDQFPNTIWLALTSLQEITLLKEDPKGFLLADFLTEDSQAFFRLPHPPHDDEIEGSRQAASRYKELYNALTTSKS